jgi:hypothetical protein
MENKKFRNFSDESFSWSWNGVLYTFGAGTEIYLEGPKADHFAKHLVDRELNKLKLPTNSPRRPEFMEKCFPPAETISAEEALNISEEAKARNKKSVSVKEKEEEFADLKVPKKK